MTMIPAYHIPNRTLKVTPEVIAASDPEEYGSCLIAQALRMRLGARSIYVTADFIKFNAPGVDSKGKPYTKPDGSAMMLRYCYPTPVKAGAKAQKFDAVGKAMGVVAAREDAQPFDFMLQAEHAFVRPVQTRGGEGRGPTRIRHVSDEKVCKRRFHGRTTFDIESSDLTLAEKKLHARADVAKKRKA